MLTFLAVLPAAVALGRLDRRLLPVAVATVVALAERGRRRSGGRHVFPVRGSLLAPLWVLERAVCSWAALGLRFGRGGVPYAGRRIRTAAHSQRWLQRTR